MEVVRLRPEELDVLANECSFAKVSGPPMSEAHGRSNFRSSENGGDTSRGIQGRIRPVSSFGYIPAMASSRLSGAGAYSSGSMVYPARPWLRLRTAVE